MKKTFFLGFFAMCLMTLSLSAFGGSFGKDDAYVEDEIEWQNVHYYFGYDPYIASLPGKPYFFLYGGIKCRSHHNNVTYQINPVGEGGSLYNSAESYINGVKCFYPGMELVEVNEKKENVLFVVDVIGENYVRRNFICRNEVYRLVVEGPDLSLAPLFFDKFEVISHDPTD